ncbi:MAG: hypothetical protein LBR08_11820 [Bacteroidales bacterium]|jgi:hypothetical protein|nr:hypothetical protein [Bacteroidales bacterium]
MKTLKHILPVIAALLLPPACSRDEMDKTVFIPDENDRKLPAYTEWGYNSFGAKYERSYFIVAGNMVPCKITYREGTLHFSLRGHVTGEVGYPYGKMTLTLSFPVSKKMEDYRDLMFLHNTKIDLTGNDCTVTIENDSAVPVAVSPLRGCLTFKRAQLLSIDDQVSKVILSGVFDMEYLTNNVVEAIEDGRFDVSIDNSDFYGYPTETAGQDR